MIKLLILSAFFLITANSSIKDHVLHDFSEQISESIKQPTVQPIHIEVINKKDDSDIFQIITIFAGFFVMAFQVYWQQKGNLKLQKENSREELKLTIYEKIEQAVSSFDKAEVSSYLTLMQVYLTTTLAEIKNSRPLTMISSRTIIFMEKNDIAANAAIQIVALIESWEIISPEFKVFRLALNSALHDLRESYTELYPLLRDHLPVDLPLEGQTKIVWPYKPTVEQLFIIQDKISLYLRNYNQLVGYTYDIKILSQNVLLKNLFENELPFRKPLDPNYIAINFQEKTIDEWIYYFENETNWGLSCKKAQQEVTKDLLYKNNHQ